MNNNIKRITRGLAEACKECITIAHNDPSAKKEIMRGGGSAGGIMTRLLMPRPIQKIRISEDALKLCLEKDVKPYDYFILTPSQIKKRYVNFFGSNMKKIEDCHNSGHFLTADHNVPNKAMLEQMFELYENNPEADVSDYLKILNDQSLDLITLEENKKIEDLDFKSSGLKILRDKACSKKIEFIDLWLTPHDVINQFFKESKLNKKECLDPCACDGRWLEKEGWSIDILPMSSSVEQKDFLSVTKSEIEEHNIKTIVGNLPFSLLDDFVVKALELVEDCYFLVNGDTILNHFPKNIEHIYIFSGLEGNQKDNRSRCEFDVPFLIKSALWCCIVHITRKKQEEWIVQHNISNDEKRDGYHIALGKNTFIKLDQKVSESSRITKIPVTSSITWKGGKKIKLDDGRLLDLKNFTNLS